MVRPKKDPEALQVNRIVIYLNDEELMDLEDICDALGMTYSAYFRLLFKFKLDFEDLSLGIQELHELIRGITFSSGGAISVPSVSIPANLRPPPPPRAPITAPRTNPAPRFNPFSTQVLIVQELNKILGPIRERMEQFTYLG